MNEFEFNRKYIENIYGDLIIPNFLPNDVLDDINSRDKVPTIVKNCLYVGHITKAKVCDLILDVAKLMPQLTFTIVGWISEEINRLERSSNVVFTG